MTTTTTTEGKTMTTATTTNTGEMMPTVWYDPGDQNWGQDGAVFDNLFDAETGARELAEVWGGNVENVATEMLSGLVELSWDDDDEVGRVLSINQAVGGLSRETVTLLTKVLHG